MAQIRCMRTVRRATLITGVFCVFVLIGLYLQKDLLIGFFLSTPQLNGIIVGIGILGFTLCFRELARITRECRVLRNLSVLLHDDSVHKLKSDLLSNGTSGLVRNRCSNVLAMSNRTGLISEVAPLLADVDADYEESKASIVRYLLGVMVLLGLIGTFWGLLSTVSGVKDVLAALQPEKIDDPVAFLSQFKASIAGMLGGLSTASTSLFGLAGAVLVGFVDVQTRQARATLLADLDSFIITSMLPATAEPTVEVQQPVEPVLAHKFDHLVNGLLDRVDVLSNCTQDLLEETRKSRESFEKSGQAIREIFEAEDRLVNKIVSIGLANIRANAGQIVDSEPENKTRKESS
jgi:hypothetical protein